MIKPLPGWCVDWRASNAAPENSENIIGVVPNVIICEEVNTKRLFICVVPSSISIYEPIPMSPFVLKSVALVNVAVSPVNGPIIYIPFHFSSLFTLFLIRTLSPSYR